LTLLTFGMTVTKALAAKRRWRVPLLCVVLLVVIGWTFLPTLQCSFLFVDDQSYVVENPHVKDGFTWTNVGAAFTSMGNSNWHPVTWLSHMLDCQLYGLKPKWHHLTNVIIHACNVMLVFLVLRKLTGATWRSWAAALLFGIHPLRVESVAWIAERKDVLSLFFWLLTIWAYACFSEESTVRSGKAKYFYGLTFLFLVLGLMSKTMLVTMPFVLWLLDYWPLERWRQTSTRNLIKEKLPFFIPVIITSILACKAQKLGGMFDDLKNLALIYRVENAFVSYARYLGKLFWPADLCIQYPHPVQWPLGLVIASVLLVVWISVLVLAGRRRVPYVLTGWFWYLGTLVPVIGIVQIGSQSMADRYTYIPTIGIVMLLVWGVCELTQHWRLHAVGLSTLLAALTIVCIWRTRDEIQYWTNDINIWSRAIVVAKDNYVAHYQLGLALWHTPLKDDALNELRASVSIKPDLAPAQKFLGSALEELHRYPEALDHFNQGLAVEPTDAQSWYNGAVTCVCMGQLNHALGYCLKSVSIDTNAPAQEMISQILQRQAQAKQQNADLRTALEKEPDHAELINKLAWFLATTLSEDERNGNEAVQLATRACELIPNHPAYMNTLAAAYAETGQFDKAIAMADMACSLAEKAGDEQSLKGCQMMREYFRAHQPCYELSVYNKLPGMP